MYYFEKQQRTNIYYVTHVHRKRAKFRIGNPETIKTRPLV